MWESFTLFSEWLNSICVSLCGKARSEDGCPDRVRDSRWVWGKPSCLKMKVCQSKCAVTGDAAICWNQRAFYSANQVWQKSSLAFQSTVKPPTETDQKQEQGVTKVVGKCVLCGCGFIVLKVKGKWLNGRQEEMKQAAKWAIFAIKLDSDLNYADLVHANTNVSVCTCARVCVSSCFLLSVMVKWCRERESGGKWHAEDECFSCDPEQGRKANGWQR